MGLFDNLVCAEDELCSDEEVIGVCVSASSSHRPRWLPMGADGVGALEAEMTRVAGLGFDWPHPYTQCVFQTLLHHIRNRRSYSSAECSQLMAEPDQLGEPLVSDKIMQDTVGKTYNNPGEYIEDNLPYAGAQEDQEEHGLEKRNYAATSYNLLLPQGDEEAQADLYNLIQPEREEYFVPPC